MTTTALAPPTGTARATRLPGVVAVAVLGPLAVAVLRGLLPYSTADDPLTIATNVAADPGAQSAVLALSYLALLTLPLGVLIVSRLAVRTRPVLGAIGATLAWVGYASLFWVIASDHVALAAPAAGLSPTAVAALNAGIESQPSVLIASIAFVVGHILGTVLLAIALWRAVPRWAALALAVSQPLHLVFAVIAPNHLLDALAWGLTAVGFAAVAMVAGRVER